MRSIWIIRAVALLALAGAAMSPIGLLAVDAADAAQGGAAVERPLCLCILMIF